MKRRALNTTDGGSLLHDHLFRICVPFRHKRLPFQNFSGDAPSGMIHPTKVKEPDPQIWKSTSMPSTSLSVASTVGTLFYPFKASFADLAGLVEPEPISLPAGALDDFESTLELMNPETGDRHGKFVARTLSREISIDTDSSDIEPEMLDLFSRLLEEGDRVTTRVGVHIKFQKLTTSKMNPYKTLLRHM
jgi:hypothetical protein